ncbi:TIGR01212 family radical SAM protein, partial [Thermodesulfobacteriota bacterium]
PNRDGSKGRDGCIYCNPRGSGTGAYAAGVSIREQVRTGVDFLSGRYKCRKFIAYFQSFTNTYAPPDHLSRVFEEAVECPEIVGLAIGTRPDCVADPVLDTIGEFAQQQMVWIEYGLQSAQRETLALIKRGHSPEDFFDAVTRTKDRGILTVAHLILGLPGESLMQMLETAQAVAEAQVWGVKLHPLYVIRGTALEDMYSQGRYRPMSEDESLEATLSVLSVLPSEMVIHRLTSDPHPEELVAPQWMLDGRGVRDRLVKAMKDRDLVQGSRYG